MNQVKQLSNVLFLASVMFVCCTPIRAFAAVQITEIMYDVPGTDTGREWVEVTNTGSVAEDLGAYRLFEGNTNHSITVLSGSGILVAGASAVVVEDGAKFAADWPSYAGPVLKSSFSLSNTGETIGIKDSSLTLVDSATYDSSMGAAGDGNSLQRSGATFAAGAANPGTYSGSASPSTPNQQQSSSSPPAPGQTQQVSAGTVSGPASLSIDIDAEPYVLVGAGSFFTGSASDDKGQKSDARYIWSFGDGATEIGQTVFHSFTYPGTYIVELSAGWGVQAGIGRITVEAAPPQVGLLVEPDGSIAVMNKAQNELNLGLWSITSGTTTFVIPEHTILMAHGSVRFATSVMHMSAGQDAALRYPNQTFVAGAIPVHAEPAQNFSSGSSEPGESSASASAKSRVGSAAKIQATTEKTSSTTPTILVAAAGQSGFSLPLWSYVLGGAGFVFLGIGGASYVGFPRRKVTNIGTDEFEIE